MNIHDAIAEIQQPRSRYQLIHFVIGQHDTPEMRYYQLCLELQDMGYKLRMAQLGVRKAEIEIARLLETSDELDAIEAEEKQVGLEQTQIVMRGAEREMAILTDLFDESQKFTRDEIEHAQPEYWEKRLTRQTNLQIMSGGVQWAQLDSMRQIGMLDELVEAREAQIADQVKLELAE
ncbi:MAG: hypothetical protein HOD33_03695 [Acidiferrobacteraceae bacterium]|jgi:hypothetical protein|nr:hypothetical protein [Acidiferrobacteraceae bacterium]